MFHPDLAELGRKLQDRFDRVAEAEQEAAAVLARRGGTLRDRLLDAEDAQMTITVTTRTGHGYRGRLEVVAFDHLEIHLEIQTGCASVMLVPLDQVVAVSLA